MLELLIPFAIGFASGLFLYSKGYRAQNPFHKVTL